MSGRCKDCRWWEGIAEAENLGWASCERAVSFKAVVADKIFEDDNSSIMTGPEFGCVHFEKREA